LTNQDSTRVADRVRRLLDGWYRRLPALARAEIRQRFTAPVRRAHLGAFWEMYLHAATSRLDFDIDIDVGRGRLVGSRPTQSPLHGASYSLAAYTVETSTNEPFSTRDASQKTIFEVCVE
jgi:hypothetical protein